MKKQLTPQRLFKIIQTSKSSGQKIGLITGCFDIIHAGHIDLFRYAKKHVDTLIIGLENDDTIRLSKGPTRPIHHLAQRSLVISEMASVDYVFAIPITVKFGNSTDIQAQYVNLVKKINPDYLITSPQADKYWSQKQQSLKPLGIKLLKFISPHTTSTTAVLHHLQKEL
jgi:cytidyltransferase-like protein